MGMVIMMNGTALQVHAMLKIVHQVHNDDATMQHNLHYSLADLESCVY
jgi:hypothetical protein